ncbi:MULTISPECIES: amino acid-binding protein [Providencia]|uniref:Amino acid-binding protein n=1 Tax=Providencia rettgeri TaxID=587 RepID=A0AB35L868_PRORE|nr:MULTISPECIES: amino acid-binding protein [Providencia]AWS50858.1 amino acid-binding protein [Providencia rettgeri]EHZ7765118.1 amino acid-binding protein [Providencia rettgeri]EIJ7168260.1 amino acid-binding protein [Providencia rettgeri]EJD6046350.1 amino acid-binding protein [Providencia rettgeri]EJD6477147.1 amino acid-binding protein [Providencia rettgeri]
MYDIHVIIENQVGALALLATTLGKHGIGLEGGGVFSIEGKSHAHFLVTQPEKASNALATVGLKIESISKPVIRKLKQERPGELGEIVSLLARHQINILVQYSDHNNRLILITDNNILTTEVTKKWENLPYDTKQK